MITAGKGPFSSGRVTNASITPSPVLISDELLVHLDTFKGFCKPQKPTPRLIYAKGSRVQTRRDNSSDAIAFTLNG